MSHTERVVVLVDMDCFYCQVEEKLEPRLQGKPMAVVQYNEWKGGGIIAVNYLARDKGVTRHMRGDEAKQKCPDIELVRVPNVRGKAGLTKYRDAGKRVAQVLQTFTPLLQRASVDEAYLDITEQVANKLANFTNQITVNDLQNTHVVGCDTEQFIRNVYDDLHVDGNLKLIIGGSIVEEIRAAVYEKTGYRCSAGIAHNKILAKLACGLHKPNQQTILPQDGVQELYENLPLRKIKSLGGKFGTSLSEELQITNMGELSKFSVQDLVNKYDQKTALWLYNIARGIDLEPVTTRLVSKSIGCCKRFPGKNMLKSSADVTHWLTELATEISERLQEDLEEYSRRAKNITVSYSQEVSGKDVASTRTMSLQSYNMNRIVNDSYETLKKYTLQPDGSFKIKFLGLSAGKFESCKNLSEISSFFKVINNKIDKGGADEATSSVQQNTSEIDEHDFSTSTIELDCSDKIKDKLEYPCRSSADNDGRISPQTDVENLENTNGSEPINVLTSHSVSPVLNSDFGDTSKSFFKRFLLKRQVDTAVDETNTSCHVIAENVCPECKTPVPAAEYVSHMDHHMAMSLMEQEQNRQRPHKPPSPKHVKARKNKSKRKTGQPQNNSLLSFFKGNPNDGSTGDTQVCAECQKDVPLQDFSSHLDYHAAKKLHLELNPVKQIQRVCAKKSGTATGLGLMNYFKTSN